MRELVILLSPTADKAFVPTRLSPNKEILETQLKLTEYDPQEKWLP
jgi:hypothetical protein